MPRRASSFVATSAGGSQAQTWSILEIAREYAELVEPEAAMFALDLAIFEGGVLDDYLDQRGDLLPGDELTLVERWHAVPLAPYEVTAVQPGHR